MIAVVTQVEHPDLSKFDTEREGMFRQIASRKEKMLYEGWMKRLFQNAKVDKNPDVVRSGADSGAEG